MREREREREEVDEREGKRWRKSKLRDRRQTMKEK